MTPHKAAAVIVCALMAIALSIPAAYATPRLQCDNNGRCNSFGSAQVFSAKRHYAERQDVEFVAHPAGCPRRLFCACGLAEYWGLGKGLNKVSIWPRLFARAHGPSVGLAAVRRDQHHVMGIIGGSAGAWRVIDFNSGGHKSRIYTVADFRGYFFVDPRTRMASR